MSPSLKLLRAIVFAFPTIFVGFYRMLDTLLYNIGPERTNPEPAHRRDIRAVISAGTGSHSSTSPGRLRC